LSYLLLKYCFRDIVYGGITLEGLERSVKSKGGEGWCAGISDGKYSGESEK